MQVQSSSIKPVNFLEQWKPISILGTGSSSEVFLVQDNESHLKKVIKVFNSNVKASFAETEAQMLMSLDHPRILSASGYFPKVSLPSSDNHYRMNEEEQYVSAIALEYVSNGDLLGLIQSAGRLPENLARTYFLQLLGAIEYLHANNICHLDIKPDNILIDQNYNIKLADFGVAAEIPKHCDVKGVVGTAIYHSPEMLSKLAYNPYQADLFALGITLFTMVTENVPFYTAQITDPMYKLITEGNFGRFWEIHESMRDPESAVFSENFKTLIEGMLGADAKERFTLERIRGVSWLEVIVLATSEEQICQMMNEVLNKSQNCSEEHITEECKPDEDLVLAAC